MEVLTQPLMLPCGVALPNRIAKARWRKAWPTAGYAQHRNTSGCIAHGARVAANVAIDQTESRTFDAQARARLSAWARAGRERQPVGRSCRTRVARRRDMSTPRRSTHSPRSPGTTASCSGSRGAGPRILHAECFRRCENILARSCGPLLRRDARTQDAAERRQGEQPW